LLVQETNSTSKIPQRVVCRAVPADNTRLLRRCRCQRSFIVIGVFVPMKLPQLVGDVTSAVLPTVIVRRNGLSRLEQTALQ
jgi:hypothetical protein